MEDAYDVARICELEFTADELGAFTVRCERQFTPLRWAVRRRGERYVVRLLDDTGADVQSRVTRAAFETPCSEEEIGVAPEYDVPSSGGMYVARIHALTAAIILPPIVGGLADLRCSPSVDRGTRSAESILRALSIARLWDGARLTGNFFSAMRQRDVLFALTTHVVGLVCGDNWTRAEAAVRQEKDGLARLQDAISKRHEERAVGELLAREYTALAGATCEERIARIASLAMKLHLLPSAQPGDDSDPRWLSELALRLASAPADVEDWAGHKFRAGVTRLLEVPTLARAARFLVVAIDVHLESRAAPGELYAGWGWR